jgi:transcription elongation factor Elf1
MDQKTQKFFDDCRKIAEGKLLCPCGNHNWRQFLFVSGAAGLYTAGCKKCGTCFQYHNEAWSEIAKGPGRID